MIAIPRMVCACHPHRRCLAPCLVARTAALALLRFGRVLGPQVHRTNQVPNARFVVETSVPMTPEVAGPFVQGIWTGNLTIPNAITNVFLRAVDAEGHAGFGNAFAVQGNSTLPLAMPGRILTVQSHTEGTEVSFASQSGVRYLVERSTDFASGQWTPVNAAVTGDGKTIQVVDRVAANRKNCFYRVRVIP